MCGDSAVTVRFGKEYMRGDAQIQLGRVEIVQAVVEKSTYVNAYVLSAYIHGTPKSVLARGHRTLQSAAISQTAVLTSPVVV